MRTFPLKREGVPLQGRDKAAGIGVAIAAIIASVLLTSTPVGATTLGNDFDSLNCKSVTVSTHHVVQGCAELGRASSDPADSHVFGAGDVTGYVKNAGNLTQDQTMLVSEDSVQVYLANGTSIGITAYPSGPQAGHTIGATRGEIDLSSYAGKTIYTKATFGIWKNGSETSSWTVKSNMVHVPAPETK